MLPIADNPNDPRIALIREAVLKNPNITMRRILIGYEVGDATVKAWIKKGWLPQLGINREIQKANTRQLWGMRPLISPQKELT